ncbi:Bromodomain containing protein [Tritrichomonas foetus]|uniref:Bromodomain containing protein n=1 Tax=Tritrichomonas foetus TaxID=1144522 RepID=A0A1J4JVY2_9EUKA|nr:Bromodomain containing protein [Tritrichomonas foetus]|eukprot:OHT01684.1 Bromodomain containing protein [Tritrichomonas foetus]
MSDGDRLLSIQSSMIYSTSIDSYLSEQCKIITKEVKDHPLSLYFREPFTADQETMTIYYQKVSQPMDLSTVQRNLQLNSYQNFECWARDIILIFDNAIAFNTIESLPGCIAAYLKKRTQKRINNLYYNNLRNYEARLYELITDVNRLIENPPSQLGVKAIVSKETPILESFTKPRIEKLMRSLNTLLNNNKLPQILEVLKESGDEIEIGPQQEIDIAGISRKSINNLEAFVAANSK